MNRLSLLILVLSAIACTSSCIGPIGKGGGSSGGFWSDLWSTAPAEIEPDQTGFEFSFGSRLYFQQDTRPLFEALQEDDLKSFAGIGLSTTSKSMQFDESDWEIEPDLRDKKLHRVEAIITSGNSAVVRHGHEQEASLPERLVQCDPNRDRAYVYYWKMEARCGATISKVNPKIVEFHVRANVDLFRKSYFASKGRFRPLTEFSSARIREFESQFSQMILDTYLDFWKSQGTGVEWYGDQ